MSRVNQGGKRKRIFIITGSILALIMGFFHASGVGFMVNTFNDSDASEFLKEIFPILFLSPSLQLIGLSMFGFATLKMSRDRKYILLIIAFLLACNACFGIYLGAWIPAVLLILAAVSFVLAAWDIHGLNENSVS